MKRILVADDSVTIQKVIALTFADEPFEVQSVGTGSEALELVKSWKPDIVLADVIMPQMNGYELCKAVKQVEEAGSVPVLLLAGTFEAFDEEEAKSVGADDFITKPFESGELIEKVKMLMGDVPAAPPAGQPPVVDEETIAVEPAEVPEVITPAEVPSPEPESTASEPDIWDILSESGDDVPAKEAVESGQAPSFGPIEDTGVVDVGSFDVGIGRPESQPVPSQPASEVPPETLKVPEVPEPTPQPEFEVPPTVPPVEGEQQDMDEKSRVENMEKDFFGFETGAVEETTTTDFLDEAVEEVTFEMEPPQGSQEPDSQDASFVVPEPAGDQAIVTGETISPETMAPEPPSPGGVPDQGAMGEEMEDRPEPVAIPVPDPIEIPEFVPEPLPDQEPAPDPVIEPAAEPSFGEVAPVAAASAATSASTTAEAMVDKEAMVDMEAMLDGEGMAGKEVVVEADLLDDAALDMPADESITEPGMPADLELQPEPPLELPVDLTPDLPEEFSPGPVEEPVVEESQEIPLEPPAVVPPAPDPGTPAEVPLKAAVDVPDDETIKKILEEKVEKIVWEVVPEMAEVIIREAIQKIKDRS